MPEEKRGRFELLPNDGSAVTADDELDAALGNVVVDDPRALRPQGRSWAFDFERGQFIARGRGPAEVHGEAALRVWIEKTLRTARFAHTIYSDGYGIDMPDVIGRAPTPGRIGQYTEAVKAALLVHDRIEGVADFRFTQSPDVDFLLVTFTVQLVEDEEIEVDPLLVGGAEVTAVPNPVLEQQRIPAAS
jgi:hypothetical protein